MNAAAIAGYPGASLLQKGRERELWWIPPSPSRPTLVAKVHREKDLSARLRRRLGWGRARLEWHFLKSAEAREVPVPRPVGWFTSPTGDGVFTEYLLDFDLVGTQLIPVVGRFSSRSGFELGVAGDLDGAGSFDGFVGQIPQ